MTLQYDIGAFEMLRKLLDEFAVFETTTPTEFIEQKLEEAESCVDEDVARLFLNYQKHKEFLQLAAEDCNAWGGKVEYIPKTRMGKDGAPIIIYLAVFELNAKNSKLMLECFKQMLPASAKVFQYLHVESNFVEVVQAACAVFDNEYVLQKIVKPLLGKAPTIKAMYKELIGEIAKRKLAYKRQPTIPIPSKLSPIKLKLKTKSEPKLDTFKFKAKAPPQACTREADLQKLQQAKEANMKKALQLLEYARKHQLKCSLKKPKPTPIIRPPSVIKARPVPKLEQVEVKNTAGGIMRQAALNAKVCNEEMRKFEELSRGAFDETQIAKLEEEARKLEQKQHLHEIERKHLMGLLTYEEAILAKKKLQAGNKDKKRLHDEERAKWLQDLEDWKEQEMNQAKAAVAKAHEIEKSAKDAEKNAIKEKQCKAKLLNFETRQLLQRAYEERQAELNRKIELIKEVKALQQINAMTSPKEFDRTESSNLGLMCEMSIAELQERLNLLRLKMREDLEERKQKIAATKKRQQNMLQRMKEFNETTKILRQKPDISPVTLEETQDLLTLRQRLERARNARKSC